MAGTPYLVDSNVLLRWVKPDDRDYPLVVSAIDAILQRGAVFCYTSQNVAEFWNTCTRPLDRNGYGLSPQEADRRARFFEDKLRLLPDGLAVHQEWRKLLVVSNVSGVHVHDARLSAGGTLLRMQVGLLRGVASARVWAPLLFEDEELPKQRQQRDPVLPPSISESAQAEELLLHQTADGLPATEFPYSAFGLSQPRACDLQLESG